jgi:alkanesulfonate monooxygenase SsuD/methylene tetrahydromethanopterin reductase-like flavin-dependent oxidoreductase (luciferase family)
LIAHGFTTAEYVREVTVPNLRRGLDRTGRARADVVVSVPAMVVLADDDGDRSLAAARDAIAFYGSTPAYRPVPDHHGWGALGDELHALSRRGEWASMGELIDDEVLHTFAVVGDAPTVARELEARYCGVVDRMQLGLDRSGAATAELVDALHAGP